VIFFSIVLSAKGTVSGTEIVNSATISYSIFNENNQLETNSDIFKVERVIDINIQSQDTVPVEVNSGDDKRVLTFLVSNNGNSVDSIALGYNHINTDFIPMSVKIYVDTNDDGVFSDGDLEVTKLDLGADESVIIFVVSDIPENADRNEESNDSVVISSLGQPITDKTGEQNNTNTVIISNTAKDVGTYKIRNYWMDVNKTQNIHSDDNSTHTGSIVTYSIELCIGGDNDEAIIKNVVLKDSIPNGTKYIENTLRLDGSSTEAYDNGVISVEVPDLVGSACHEVTFDVQIQ